MIYINIHGFLILNEYDDNHNFRHVLRKWIEYISSKFLIWIFLLHHFYMIMIGGFWNTDYV